MLSGARGLAGIGASYVFSVDVEDSRPKGEAGRSHASRVPALTHLYLDFLARNGSVGTFFVVGEVARAHPDLIRRIVAEGHEIGCHSDRHILLRDQDPGRFRDDLRRNLDSLHDAGAGEVIGYRAPCFSLTRETDWAYPILAELGFAYSSSVLPALNPIAGWPGFGEAPRLIQDVVELPMTLLPYRPLPVPMGGGVYFRVLPMPLLRRAFERRFRRGEPVLGYLHPYDVDTDQGHSPDGFSRWGVYHWLLRANRGAVFDRLEVVRRMGYGFTSYAEYARSVRARLEKDEGKE